MRTVVVLAAIALVAGSARAGNRLVIALDVPGGELPGTLCVVSRTPSTETTPLATLFGTASAQGDVGMSWYHLFALENFHHPQLPGDVQTALERLVDGSSHPCEDCRTSLRLPARVIEHDAPAGHIICGRNSSGGDRVAFVFLDFSIADGAAGVFEVELVGSVATLDFRYPLKSTAYPVAQIIGGDYVASGSSSYGTRERIQLTLQPRYVTVPIELPPGISPDAVGPPMFSFATVERERPNVGALRRLNDALYLDVPNERSGTKVTLTFAMAAHPETPMLQTSWIGGLPSPLRPGLRDPEFSWRPPCLSDLYGAHPSPTATCPTALVAGKTYAGAYADGLCRYHGAPKAPLALPAPVHFERRQLFGWDDILEAAGDTLGSFVPPDGRKVVVTLDPETWDPHEWLDEVELVLPTGTTSRIDLGKQTSWKAISTPNIGCSDTIRLRLRGEHIYQERAFAAEGGVVPLEAPSRYRARNHFALLFGASFTDSVGDHQDHLTNRARFGTALVLGGALEIYLSALHALEVEVTSSTSRAALVDLPTPTTVAFDRVWYERWDVRVTHELWVAKRLHVGYSVGAGFAVPLLTEDDEKFGALRFSALAAVNLRMVLGHQRFEGVLGVRLFEHHELYTFDAAGVGHADPRMITIFMASLRYRFTLL
ncbi:MAG TPA: hypothetical protein VGM88_33780 [Kofleriaceae bacterium]|jgi:hypothetical protein